MKLPSPVSFEWDEGNIKKNWEKHNVHYREAEEVFFDKEARIFKDKNHSQVEDRHTILGSTENKRLLYVTFTVRGTKVRIISARDQSIKERKFYAKK